MLDAEYLARAILKGYLCPNCRQDYLDARLQFPQKPIALAFCRTCKVEYQTFKEMFDTCARELCWGDDAWAKWLGSHPDYEENP